jgi:hypothetical protein
VRHLLLCQPGADQRANHAQAAGHNDSALQDMWWGP